MQVYRAHTLRADRFSPSPPSKLRPSKFGGQCCIISKGLSSSTQLCVGCALPILGDAVERTPPHHLLSALHIQLEAEQTGAKLLPSDIIILQTWEKHQWISVAFDSPYIVSAVFYYLFIYFVCTADDKFYSTIWSTHRSSHPYSAQNVMFTPQSRCKTDTKTYRSCLFLVFKLLLSSLPLLFFFLCKNSKSLSSLSGRLILLGIELFSYCTFLIHQFKCICVSVMRCCYFPCFYDLNDTLKDENF